MNINRWLIIWIILITGTLTVMGGAVIAPVLNLIRDGLGVSPDAAGLIITTHGLFIALFSPLIGVAIDKIGTKKPFIFGLLLYGLAGSAGLYISSYWPLIISRAIFGIAIAATANSITVIILNLFKGSERDKIMGWRASANNVGGIIWQPIGGFLGTFSWHMPFIVYSVGLPVALLTFLSLPEVRREEQKNTEESDSVLNILRSKPVLFAIYSLFLLAMLFLYVNVVFIPQLLGEIGVQNPFHISLFLMTIAVMAGLIAFMYKAIRAKLSFKMISLIALGLWTFGLITISQTSNSWLIGTGATIYGAGLGLVLPTVMLWAGELVPFSFRGRIISYMSTVGFLGQFLSPIIFGQFLPIWGLHGVFIVAGGLSAIVFLLFLILVRSKKAESK